MTRSKAAPPCQLACTPSPHAPWLRWAQPPPPPFQATALLLPLFSLSPRRLTGPAANSGSCLSYSRIHFLFLPAGCKLRSRGQSQPFPSTPFTHLLHPRQARQSKALEVDTRPPPSLSGPPAAVLRTRTLPFSIRAMQDLGIKRLYSLLKLNLDLISKGGERVSLEYFLPTNNDTSSTSIVHASLSFGHQRTQGICSSTRYPRL